MNLPDFNEIEKMSVDLWPQNPDYQPKTGREEAIFRIVAAMIDMNNRAIENHVREATKDHKVQAFGTGFQTPHGVVRLTSNSDLALDYVRRILNGE